ncbi:putative PB1 domain, Zinc finger, ZZ-type, UBA-like superfamily, immunoglobulin-like protein [Helianthus annuus]|nr:putative PB1 domain, Zinc finger, ZZ-type, UBA-like superfamily, immunoglobulin-like protein [Helianthus annuus]KAJ0459234.1 putative PB1 domain, Zinc finger, ZZ-type, UBA-like superfamily, immunoglobulin-like protein [Helianthus annuus]
MASSSIVIKVKFGETLRRLNASIKDKKLALDMDLLEDKIRSLFNLGSGVEFTMTYVDEDGDDVTLADDSDLHDVVQQSLNPLRITVNLKGSSKFNGSSGISTHSTPVSSPQNPHPFQTLNAGVSEILKSIPEPFLEALAKLPLELASKASSSSAPAVAELVEKMKTVYLNEILPSMATPSVHPTTGGPPNTNSESATGKNSKVQVNPEAGGSNTKKKEKQVEKVTVGATGKNSKEQVNPEAGGSNTKKKEKQVEKVTVGEGSTGKNKKTTDGVEKNEDRCSEKKDDSLNEPLKHGIFGPFAACGGWYAQNATDINKNTNASGSFLYEPSKHGFLGPSFAPHGGWNAQNATDINKNTNAFGSSLYEPSKHGFLGPSAAHGGCSHSKRYNGANSNTGNVFHRGIICDGCGVHPITGPRFRSKVKFDYDLCSICFAEMGNATDYIRMDHPTNSFSHHLLSSKGFYDPSLRIPPLGTPGSNPSLSKLDSQFVLDVNVLDGTVMAPHTAFTKIWRMRNNGSIVWPYGSQFQWIGGDRLSSSRSVNVEIPVHGLPVDKEIDVAVDFTAPEIPGRYVSYWRMSSPSGEKFGQWVWVVIQVDASMKNLGETSINLNLPPVTRDPEMVNQDNLVDNVFLGNNTITDSANTSVDTTPKDHSMNVPINDSLITDNDGVSSTIATLSTPPETASVSAFSPAEVRTALGLDSEPIGNPTVDISVMPPITSSGAASLPTAVVQRPSGSGSEVVTDDKEQALVKELEAMGFKNLDLNKEILRTNNYDLDKSIDDLCGILEWDPILDELREMGFVDDEANRRLLKKNNGSIKGVVMDLISEEKA